MNPIPRRQFIRDAARAGTAVAAGSAIVGFPSVRRSQAATQPMVLALIGAGGRAASHAAGMSKMPGVDFKYVCDVWKERGGGITQDLAMTQSRPPQRIHDMRVALEDKEVDAVVIATPEHWHALATVWACQAGKDVFVEKNPSMSVWKGRKMIEAARKYRRIVQVGFQNHGGP